MARRCPISVRAGLDAGRRFLETSRVFIGDGHAGEPAAVTNDDDNSTASHRFALGFAIVSADLL